MKRFTQMIQKLYQSNNVLRVFSLLAAFVVWLFIVYSQDTNYPKTVPGVPVWSQSASEKTPAALEKQELSVISVTPDTVEVSVEGKRYDVIGLKPEAVNVRPDLSMVVNAGTQEVPLIWTDTSDGAYAVKSISPSSVSVRVDRLDKKVLDVQSNITGVALKDGFIKQDEIVSPERVTVTGPKSDLNKVVHAIVSADMRDSLSATETVTSPIILRDADGNEINNPNITVDFDSAEVTIPILKKKEVALDVQFLNTPEYFPVDELEYTLSDDMITIAGPQTLVDSYGKITLGYVDFKRLEIGARQVFDVDLPSGFVNVDNIQSVSVSFATDDFETRSFDIPEIQVVNQPANYEITIDAINRQLRGVRVIGPADTLNTMTAEDLVAQVDLSGRERTLATGTVSLPVKVFAPSSGTVWAYGDYSVLATIKQK